MDFFIFFVLSSILGYRASLHDQKIQSKKQFRVKLGKMVIVGFCSIEAELTQKNNKIKTVVSSFVFIVFFFFLVKRW